MIKNFLLYCFSSTEFYIVNTVDLSFKNPERWGPKMNENLLQNS